MKTLLLFLLTASLATAQAVVWTSVQPGVWKATVGKPEAYNLLTASGATPNVGSTKYIRERRHFR